MNKYEKPKLIAIQLKEVEAKIQAEPKSTYDCMGSQ